MNFAAKLETFEGPLDLLLHLIDKNKIDIYDIPISIITDQYLEYLDSMEDVDADVMSDFLVMAATLLDIKAKMLLPADTDEEGNEEDPRAELVERLLEYKLFKYMASELKDKSINAEKSLCRAADIPEEVAGYETPIDLDEFLGDLTLVRLKEIFDDVMARSQEKVNESALQFGRIQKEEVKITERIDYIRSRIKTENKLSFRKLIESQKTKMNVIVTFLAVLELMKNGELSARQSGKDSDIILGKPAAPKDTEEVSDDKQ